MAGKAENIQGNQSLEADDLLESLVAAFILEKAQDAFVGSLMLEQFRLALGVAGEDGILRTICGCIEGVSQITQVFVGAARSHVVILHRENE